MKRIHVYLFFTACLFAFFVFLANPQIAKAETKTFTVTNDAWVSSKFPTQNYGQATQLFLFHNSYDSRSYFNFDLTSLPAHSTITRAVLTVYEMYNDGQDCNGQPTTFTFSLADSSWAENGINWNNKPGSAGDYNGWLSCLNGWEGNDVTSLVQKISDGTTNNGFFIYGSGANFMLTLLSRESSPDRQAHLEVTYRLPVNPTPVPPNDQTAVNGNGTDNSSGQNSNGSSSQSSDSAMLTQQGITSGTSQAPSVNTSSSIKPPTNLSAKDAANDKRAAITLTWQKSPTSKIDGYRIFRSDKEKEGFTNIATANAQTFTFTDEKVDSGKTYYYFVRSYSGNDESVSSSTVMAKSQKSSSLPATNNLAAQNAKNNIWLRIGLGLLALVIIAGVVALLIVFKRKSSAKSEKNIKSKKE